MGQRLNIEIWNNGQVLANAYYHWSGYTSSSIALTRKVIDNIDNINCDDDRLKAVWLLQNTGAGLNEDERKSIFAKGFTNLTPCYGRNEGLISITDNSIQETRAWEEARVTIYLDERRIDFNVGYREKKWDYDKECDELDKPTFDALPIIEWNLKDIKFADFNLFEQLLTEMIENKQYDFRIKTEPWTVFSMIE